MSRIEKELTRVTRTNDTANLGAGSDQFFKAKQLVQPRRYRDLSVTEVAMLCDESSRTRYQVLLLLLLLRLPGVG